VVNRGEGSDQSYDLTTGGIQDGSNKASRSGLLLGGKFLTKCKTHLRSNLADSILAGKFLA
jgi:hypothetical protein